MCAWGHTVAQRTTPICAIALLRTEGGVLSRLSRWWRLRISRASLSPLKEMRGRRDGQLRNSGGGYRTAIATAASAAGRDQAQSPANEAAAAATTHPERNPSKRPSRAIWLSGVESCGSKRWRAESKSIADKIVERSSKGRRVTRADLRLQRTAPKNDGFRLAPAPIQALVGLNSAGTAAASQ